MPNVNALSVYNLDVTYDTSTSSTKVTVSGKATPPGATVQVRITFANGNQYPAAGPATTTAGSDGSWSVVIDVGQESGAATIEADSRTDGFGGPAVTFGRITVPVNPNPPPGATTAPPRTGR